MYKNLRLPFWFTEVIGAQTQVYSINTNANAD